MKDKTRRIISVCAAALCVVLLAVGIVVAMRSKPKEYNQYYSVSYELAKVEKVILDNYEIDNDAEHAKRGSQSLSVRIITGAHKGDVMPITNYLGPLHEKLARKGTVLTVMITKDSREAGYQISVINYDLKWIYVVMILLFIAAVVIVGRKKGVMSLFGLAYSILAIVFFLVPMWLKGYKAVPLTILTAASITVFSFTLLGGFTRKSLAAICGTLACVLVAGAFAAICGAIGGVSGLNMEEAEWLLDEGKTLGITLNVRGLLVSGIIIASLGAVMDVAMSIASAVNELSEVDPSLPRGRLFKSGMNIGRDMIGTMTNTLILAFVGSSLNLIIIMFAAGMQPYQLINNDDTFMEVIKGVAGSIGLVLAVPLTAFIASGLKKSNKQKQ